MNIKVFRAFTSKGFENSTWICHFREKTLRKLTVLARDNYASKRVMHSPFFLRYSHIQKKERRSILKILFIS